MDRHRGAGHLPGGVLRGADSDARAACEDAGELHIRRRRQGGRGTATLQTGREEWTAGPARARSEGAIDQDLVALRMRRPDGATVATLVVYAMHPTSAPRDVLSADWPAQLETDAPVLVLQGAVGNSTWLRGEPLGPPIAKEVERLLSDAPPLSEAPIQCLVRVPSVPPAQASKAVPWLLRRAASNLLRLGFETAATQTTVRIGPLILAGVPGEAVGELGKKARPVVLISLAGGYLRFVQTPRAWG